jgi:hypothetical protein
MLIDDILPALDLPLLSDRGRHERQVCHVGSHRASWRRASPPRS